MTETNAITDINQLVEEIAPSNILVVDLKNSSLLDNYASTHPACTITVIDDIQQLDNAGHKTLYDIAILNQTLEYLEKTEAGIIISRLRDIYSRRLLALAPIAQTGDDYISEWHDTDLRAYGLTQLTAYKDNRHLYEYNILNYKSVPDWLSAKNWANPELWDKYRW